MSQENGQQKKKPVPRAAKLLAKFRPDVPKDDLAKKETPTLLDVMLPIFEDGIMVRQPGRMTILADGGSWRVSIEAPTEQLQAVLMVDSLATLQAELERMLASGGVKWGMSWAKRKKSLPTIDAPLQ